MRLLVTGGAGFIGSNFILYTFQHYPDWEIVNLDKLTYAGNLENLKDIERNPRYTFVHGDIADYNLLDLVINIHKGYDAIVNFAAESHVDRSILDAPKFVETNVQGTLTLLESARKWSIPRFIQVSTDEVYGSIVEGSFDEFSALCPSNPYSASKAAADLICNSYWKTYRTPVIVTRCTNNYGPYQFPEKLIPLALTNALEGKKIPIYGDGKNIRDWIFVRDHCSALIAVLQKGHPGEIYDIAGNNEITNLELIRTLLGILEKPEDLINFVADRPGHDRRYSISAEKISRELGWQPVCSFEEGMKSTVEWYLRNEPWWRRIKEGEYLKYYESMYLKR